MNKTPVKVYSRRDNLFSPKYLDELRSQIIFSPYLSNSQLSESFADTKGFSIIFKRSSIERVEKHFSYFSSYFKEALKSSCNAFYLNTLILESGNSVAEHLDCSISSYNMIYTNPLLVSVFYVDIPNDLQGGELVIKVKEEELQIKPQINTLVFFLGNLSHKVNQVKSSQSRISLVCEQYNLNAERLQKIPEFEIKSGVRRD
jgi:predicted 2-oxoglutarate/Fe(II)-dependent dioxygenase YbiX